MEYGRAYLWAMSRRQPWTAADHVAVLRSVGNAAAARFWCNLEDFAVTHPVSPWALPPHHPFLTAHAGGLAVRLP